MSLSIVIPTLNEGETIVTTLASLQESRGRGIEVIVVDGGSRDNTVELARSLCDCVEVAPRGRARQMNAGAALARGSILLFLHADSRPPAQALELVDDAISRRGRIWGRFDVRIDSPNLILWAVGRMMNLRSRCSGIATGDQAIFVRRAEFDRIGGFPDIPLMEDIALSRKLRRIGWPARIATPVLTSGRRWQRHGVLRTIFLMWYLRWAYFRGADPAELAVRYGYRTRDGR